MAFALDGSAPLHATQSRSFGPVKPAGNRPGPGGVLKPFFAVDVHQVHRRWCIGEPWGVEILNHARTEDAVAVQRQQKADSGLDAGLIPVTVPELLRLLRDVIIPRPGEAGPIGCTGRPGDAATSTAPAKPTSAGTPITRQHHGHNELQLPVRRDKPARRRRWKSSTPKG